MKAERSAGRGLFGVLEVHRLRKKAAGLSKDEERAPRSLR